MERVPTPDVDALAVDLDDVVTGPRIASETERGHGSGVDDEEILEPPHVRHVLVPREDESHARTLEALDRVACVVDDVPFAAGARHGQQVVMQDEDLQLGGPSANCSSIQHSGRARSVPWSRSGSVESTATIATALSEHRVPVSEQLLEMDVADVP